MGNKYLETGTIFRAGSRIDSDGNELTHTVRKIVSDHKRLLIGPHGPTAGKRITYLRDGTSVTTWINPYGLLPTLMSYVVAPERKLVVEEVLCEFLSGWYVFSKVENMLFYSAFLRNKDGTYGPTGEIQNLTSQFTSMASRCNSYINESEALVYNRGTMYSGRMREVVQVLGGMNAPIKYNYQWCETHGVFVNQDDGSWWVIEIRVGVGVSAWRLAKCRDITEDEQALLGTTLPLVPKSGVIPGNVEKITLMSAEDLAVAYTDAFPYYSEHGWAFSRTGHHTSAISITWPDDYQIATVYTITITAGLDGNPESATIEEVESGIIYGSRAYAPKFPYITEYGPTLLSYDIDYNAPALGYNSVWPLDVLYIGISESAAIIRYNIDGETNSTTNESNIPDVPTGCNGQILLDTRLSGTFYSSDWSETTYGTIAYDFGSLGRPEAIETPYYNETEGQILEQEMELVWGWSARGSGELSLRRVFSETWGAVGRIYNTGWERLVRSETFFKPLFDREVIGLYRKKRSSISRGDGQETEIPAMGAGGYYSGWVDSLDMGCGAGLTVTKYAETTCGSDFTFTALAAGEVSYTSGIAFLDGFTQTEIDSPACPSGKRTIMYGCITGNADPSCPTPTAIPSIDDQVLSQRTTTWLLSASEGNWTATYDEEEYESLDTMSDYIDDPSTASFLFPVYLDVFTGAGITIKYPGDGYYTFGDVGEYPVTEDTTHYLKGWFGIPIIPGA